MKKTIILLILSLLILVFFACDLTIPTAIEVKGTPTVRFVENINIGDMFKGILNDAINDNNTDGMTIIPCENENGSFTFLIYMELFNQPFSLDDLLPDGTLTGNELGSEYADLANDIPVTISGDKDLIGYGDPITIPFSSIGSLLDGFEFTGYNTQLYFSGSDIIDKLKIEMQIGSGAPITKTPNKQGSNIDDWKSNGYTEKTSPSGGVPITLPLGKDDIDVSYRVFIPDNTELVSNDFNGGNLKVEVVVWLPFELTATTDANIALPLFDSSDDLFGRTEPGADSMMTDIIESLRLDIKFDKNVFDDSTLTVSSKGIDIVNTLTNKTLTFEISEDTMTKINDPANWPFTPTFNLGFTNGSGLSLPKEFNITELIFTAKINYNIDLSEED